MRKLVKWTGYGVGGLLGVVLVALAAVYGVSQWRMQRHYSVPGVALAIHEDAATVARGQHLVITRGCVDCHTANLGGKAFIDDPAIGTLYATNLTSGKGGVGASMSDADWERAIRHGVGTDGTPLLFMPSTEFTTLSDSDVAAIIAYLKTLPPVNNPMGESHVGPLGRALYLAGKFPLLPAEKIDQSVKHHTAPPVGATAAYGAYLATSCSGCHGKHFSGGPIPGMPPGTLPAANLTTDPATGMGHWSEADFSHVLHTGRKPDGFLVRDPMPWRLTRELTDTETQALWLYLRSLPARPYGNG